MSYGLYNYNDMEVEGGAGNDVFVITGEGNIIINDYTNTTDAARKKISGNDKIIFSNDDYKKNKQSQVTSLSDGIWDINEDGTGNLSIYVSAAFWNSDSGYQEGAEEGQITFKNLHFGTTDQFDVTYKGVNYKQTIISDTSVVTSSNYLGFLNPKANTIEAASNAKGIIIVGNERTDYIKGGSKNDTLVSGDTTTLVGGGGADVFDVSIFYKPTIVDYGDGADKILLAVDHLYNNNDYGEVFIRNGNDIDFVGTTIKGAAGKTITFIAESEEKVYKNSVINSSKKITDTMIRKFGTSAQDSVVSGGISTYLNVYSGAIDSDVVVVKAGSNCTRMDIKGDNVKEVIGSSKADNLIIKGGKGQEITLKTGGGNDTIDAYESDNIYVTDFTPATPNGKTGEAATQYKSGDILYVGYQNLDSVINDLKFNGDDVIFKVNRQRNSNHYNAITLAKMRGKTIAVEVVDDYGEDNILVTLNDPANIEVHSLISNSNNTFDFSTDGEKTLGKDSNGNTITYTVDDNSQSETVNFSAINVGLDITAGKVAVLGGKKNDTIRGAESANYLTETGTIIIDSFTTTSGGSASFSVAYPHNEYEPYSTKDFFFTADSEGKVKILRGDYGPKSISFTTENGISTADVIPYYYGYDSIFNAQFSISWPADSKVVDLESKITLSAATYQAIDTDTLAVPVNGGAGNDILIANPSGGTFSGGAGNDTLMTGTDDATVRGHNYGEFTYDYDSNDEIKIDFEGSYLDAVLEGGEGNDTFLIAGSGKVTVNDYSSTKGNSDKIVFANDDYKTKNPIAKTWLYNSSLVGSDDGNKDLLLGYGGAGWTDRDGVYVDENDWNYALYQWNQYYSSHYGYDDNRSERHFNYSKYILQLDKNVPDSNFVTDEAGIVTIKDIENAGKLNLVHKGITFSQDASLVFATDTVEADGNFLGYLAPNAKVIKGANKNSYLVAGTNTEQIIGGSKNDTLVGNGNTYLSGGAGKNVYIARGGSHGEVGDTIEGYQSGKDIVKLDYLPVYEGYYDDSYEDGESNKNEAQDYNNSPIAGTLTFKLNFDMGTASTSDDVSMDMVYDFSKNYLNYFYLDYDEHGFTTLGGKEIYKQYVDDTYYYYIDIDDTTSYRFKASTPTWHWKDEYYNNHFSFYDYLSDDYENPEQFWTTNITDVAIITKSTDQDGNVTSTVSDKVLAANGTVDSGEVTLEGFIPADPNYFFNGFSNTNTIDGNDVIFNGIRIKDALGKAITFTVEDEIPTIKDGKVTGSTKQTHTMVRTFNQPSEEKNSVTLNGGSSDYIAVYNDEIDSNIKVVKAGSKATTIINNSNFVESIIGSSKADTIFSNDCVHGYYKSDNGYYYYEEEDYYTDKVYLKTGGGNDVIAADAQAMITDFTPGKAKNGKFSSGDIIDFTIAPSYNDYSYGNYNNYSANSDSEFPIGKPSDYMVKISDIEAAFTEDAVRYDDYFGTYQRSGRFKVGYWAV